MRFGNKVKQLNTSIVGLRVCLDILRVYVVSSCVCDGAV